MRRSYILRLSAFALGVTLALFANTIAQAYVASRKWSTNSVSFSYGSSYPTGSWRDRAQNAADSWTNVSTSSWVWSYVLAPKGTLGLASIDGAGGIIAQTSTPTSGGFVTSFTLTVDNAESWYTDAGTPASTQHDLWSMLAHELGHAAWAGHTNVACTDNLRPTMCPTLAKGTVYMRSLAADDRDGISSVYP